MKTPIYDQFKETQLTFQRIEVGNEPEQDVSSIGHTATQSEEIQTEPMCKDNQMPGTSSNTSENIAVSYVCISNFLDC